jgi:hypothetical protein
VILAKSQGEPLMLTIAISTQALVSSWCGHVDATLSQGRRLLSLCQVEASRDEQTLYRSFEVIANMFILWALAHSDPPAATSLLKSLGWAANPFDIIRNPAEGMYVAVMVEGLVKLLRVDQGIALTDAALRVLDISTDRSGESEILRLRGELRAATDTKQAIQDIRRSVELADMLGAKSLKLRALMSLYRVSKGRQKHAAALDVERVLVTFTQGHGTRDLLEARRIVETARVPDLSKRR